MMTGAGDEHERPVGFVLRLGEMTRQRDQHGEAVAVVAGAIEPGVGVRVEDDHFVAPARE